jgi:hypothetical protein
VVAGLSGAVAMAALIAAGVAASVALLTEAATIEPGGALANRLGPNVKSV